MIDKKPIVISLRDATIRYGLSRPTLIKLALQHGCGKKIGNKYMLQLDKMDEVIAGRNEG